MLGLPAGVSAGSTKVFLLGVEGRPKSTPPPLSLPPLAKMPDMKLDIFSQTDESRVQQGTNNWTGAGGYGALFVPNDVRLIAKKGGVACDG